MRPQRTFGHEVTLEALAGVGKHSRFDATIDDEEIADIQVICKHGDEESLYEAAYGQEEDH